MKFLALALVVFCVAQTTARPQMAPGSPWDVEVSDPDIVSMSKLVLKHFNTLKKEGESPLELIEIVKASKQVVAGRLVAMTLKLKEGSDTKNCNFKVVEQSWLSKIEVIEAECDGVKRIESPQTVSVRLDVAKA